MYCIALRINAAQLVVNNDMSLCCNVSIILYRFSISSSFHRARLKLSLPFGCLPSPSPSPLYGPETGSIRPFHILRLLFSLCLPILSGKVYGENAHSQKNKQKVKLDFCNCLSSLDRLTRQFYGGINTFCIIL